MDKEEKLKEIENSQEESEKKSEEENSEKESLEKVLEEEEEENSEKIETFNEEIEMEETSESENKNLEETIGEQNEIKNNLEENQYTPNRPIYNSEKPEQKNNEVNYESSGTEDIYSGNNFGGNAYSGNNLGSDAYSGTSGIQYSQEQEGQAYSGNIGNNEDPNRLKSFEEKSALEKKSTSIFGKSDLINEDNRKYSESSTLG